jgi:hypothetical protein
MLLPFGMHIFISLAHASLALIINENRFHARNVLGVKIFHLPNHKHTDSFVSQKEKLF